MPSATAVTTLRDLETTETPAQTLARLFDRHSQRLYRLALRLTGDREAARDLVQETFLRTARRPRSVPRGEAAEEAWLVRVTANLCRDRARRRAVRRRPTGAPPPAALVDGEAAAVARATVRAAMARLSPRRRAVVALSELEGLPSAGPQGESDAD